MRLTTGVAAVAVCLAVLGCSACASPDERGAEETVRALSELNDELSASGGTVRLADYAALADEPYASTAAVNRLVFRENGLRQRGRTEVEVDEVTAAGGIGVVVACLRLDDVTVGAAGGGTVSTGPSRAASEAAEPTETTAVPLRYSLAQRDGTWVITEAVPIEIEGCGDPAPAPSEGDDR